MCEDSGSSLPKERCVETSSERESEEIGNAKGSSCGREGAIINSCDRVPAR